MNQQRCPDPLALSEAFAQGERSPLSSHIASCERCSASKRLAELGRELPRELPGAARRERVLSALLAQAQITPERESRALWWALPLAASLVLVLFLWPRETPPGAHSEPHRYASITTEQEAKYSTTTNQAHQDIRLQSGELRLDAASLSEGGSLTVSTQDAVIQTIYAVFTVAAYEGRLIRVEVIEGQLVLRLEPSEERALRAGESWEATTRAAAPQTQKVAAATQPRRDAKEEDKPAPREAAPEEIAYQEGVSAMKAKDFTVAIERFSFVMSHARERSLVEDASFWYTASLLQAKREEEAKGALRNFIREFPASSRAGEGRVALGWLLLEEGDLSGAEQSFLAAREDRSAAVRASAEKGLEAVTAQRDKP